MIHGGTHSEEILSFMRGQFDCANENWLREYYQFANRIATVSFLNSQGIECKLVNLYFVDGYYDREHGVNKDTSIESFREEIERELKTLKLNEEEKNKYVIDVFVDANPLN